MRQVTFLDLDDTLLQTRHKCPPGEPIEAVAWQRDGEPMSYMTSRQKAFLDRMESLGSLVFVTARTTDSLRRVRLPKNAWHVTSFGAAIRTPDGHPFIAYNHAVIADLQPVLAILEDLKKQLHDASMGTGVRVRLIDDEGLPVYIVAKHPGGRGSALDPLESFARTILPPQFFLHRNGNNLALVPQVVAKERAVRYLIETTFPATEWTSLGVGDSHTDGPFLACCDWRVIPSNSQLSRRLDHRYPPETTR